MTSSIIEMTATVLAMVISIVVMNTAGDGCLVKKKVVTLLAGDNRYQEDDNL